MICLALCWIGGDGLRLRRSRGSSADAPVGGAPVPGVELGSDPGAASSHYSTLAKQDRVLGLMAEVRFELEQGHLSAAARAMDALRGAEGAYAGGGLLAALDQEVEDALQRTQAELEGLVDSGAAPLVARRVASLSHDLHPRVATALTNLARRRGWPRLADVRIPPGLTVPDAAALAAGRPVRLWFRDQWVTGTTAATDRDSRVSVRVDTGAGVYFPVLPQGALAVIDPDATELRAQLAAALTSGDGILASAWLATCLARQSAVDAGLRRELASWFVD